MLSKPPSRFECSYQSTESVTEYGDGEFAGPAAFALAEMAFTDKDYATALPFSSVRQQVEGTAVVLSAHYFEARCLEALGRKDEAADITRRSPSLGIQIRIAKMHESRQQHLRPRGKKLDALKQYEALANEGQKRR